MILLMALPYAPTVQRSMARTDVGLLGLCFTLLHDTHGGAAALEYDE
jgi:hypothetical protein